MPNKFGRSVPVADYTPHGLLPDGLLPIQRPAGEASSEIAAAASRVAGTFNTLADYEAKLEGTASGKAAGAERDFRPSGSTTIRGHAYDEAAIRTYQDNLDASLRTDLQKVYEANRGDPVALKQGFDTLGDEYRAQHVFPEVAGSFNAQISRLRLPYENKALADLETEKKDQSRAALINNLTASQTNAGRAAAADPNNPNTALIVGDEARRMDTMIDEAIVGEVVTAEQGAKLKISNRNTITTRAATAQAEGLKSPEDVAVYRDNARKQFAAGKFAGLTAEGYDDLDAKLEQIQKAKRTEINAGETKLQKDIGDFVQRAADGFPLSDDEWTRYASSPSAATPKGQAILQEGQSKLQVANLLKNRSVEDGEILVGRMRSELGKEGGAGERQADVVRFAEKFVKDQRAALNTDQLGLAARKQIIPVVAPLDFQGFAASDDPAAAGALASQFRARTAQARAVGTELQRSPQFLRPEERDRLKEIVDQGGPKALALAGAIVKGSDGDAPAILREISGDAPLLAQSGLIIANGGSISAARDAMEFNRLKAAGLTPIAPASSLADTVNRDIIGTAYARVPEAAGNVRMMASAIASARITRGGIDPKGSEADAIYKRAVQEAAGATFNNDVQYGGLTPYSTGFWGAKGQTVVPPGLRADALRDVVRSVTDDDLKALPVPPQAEDGRPYTAREISRAFPVATAGGYRLALGNPNSDKPLFVRGADGKPFTVSFDDVLKLAPRVPGALLGGQ